MLPKQISVALLTKPILLLGSEMAIKKRKIDDGSAIALTWGERLKPAEPAEREMTQAEKAASFDRIIAYARSETTGAMAIVNRRPVAKSSLQSKDDELQKAYYRARANAMQDIIRHGKPRTEV